MSLGLYVENRSYPPILEEVAEVLSTALSLAIALIGTDGVLAGTAVYREGWPLVQIVLLGPFTGWRSMVCIIDVLLRDSRRWLILLDRRPTLPQRSPSRQPGPDLCCPLL